MRQSQLLVKSLLLVAEYWKVKTILVLRTFEDYSELQDSNILEQFEGKAQFEGRLLVLCLKVLKMKTHQLQKRFQEKLQKGSYGAARWLSLSFILLQFPPPPPPQQ